VEKKKKKKRKKEHPSLTEENTKHLFDDG